ncbi:GntR family transcriptional regulator [Lactiplantibacillus daowaiensis]|uniref:GntR family transcriptional regulator n=1 Tax=Lactiplantibacillus daowaiensis TaxID=2559918 RepID=A0ABW1RZI3_9LACO|nr:GntR family transcriptional regulator [Lactiplantibacillus daowaiensis]
MAKYQTIYRHLRLAILQGKYAANGSLPSETAIAIKYGVSRITAKRALNDLVEAELVYRIQGKGTFVTAHQKTPPNQILLVMPTLANNQYQQALRAALNGTSWHLQVMSTTDFFNLTLTQLTDQFAGVLYYLDDLTTVLPHLMTLAANQLPLVVLNQHPAALAVPSVISDHVAGGQRACQYLQHLQHHRIAFLTHTAFWQTFTGPTSERFMGYVAALAQPQTAEVSLRWAQDLQACQDGDQLQTYLNQHQITALITEESDIICQQLRLLPSSSQPPVKLVDFETLTATHHDATSATIVPDYPALSRQVIEALLTQINNPHRQRFERTTVAAKLKTATAAH